MNSENFNFLIPVDLVKSESSENSKEMRIAGFASTSSKDRQDDEIIQKGLDISDFVNFGFLNYDHDNTKLLGHPDKEACRVDKDGFYVEGLLWDTPLGRSLYQTAIAMKKSGAPRKLGFSVEGKVEKRNSLGQIVKAKVYNVAITANPVNPTCTWDALVKSFSTDKNDFSKSIEAGYGNSSGSTLILESVERAFNILSPLLGDTEESKNLRTNLKNLFGNKKDFTDEELKLYLMVTKGLSLSESATLLNKIKEEVNENDKES